MDCPGKRERNSRRRSRFEDYQAERESAARQGDRGERSLEAGESRRGTVDRLAVQLG